MAALFRRMHDRPVINRRDGVNRDTPDKQHAPARSHGPGTLKARPDALIPVFRPLMAHGLGHPDEPGDDGETAVGARPARRLLQEQAPHPLRARRRADPPA